MVAQSGPKRTPKSGESFSENGQLFSENGHFHIYRPRISGLFSFVAKTVRWFILFSHSLPASNSRPLSLKTNIPKVRDCGAAQQRKKSRFQKTGIFTCSESGRRFSDNMRSPPCRYHLTYRHQKNDPERRGFVRDHWKCKGG